MPKNNPACLSHPSGTEWKISGTPAHQHPIPWFQIQHAYGPMFPEIMGAETEQGVHQVIFAGHRIKMAADPFGFVRLAQFFETEIVLIFTLPCIRQLFETFKLLPSGVI